MRVGETSLRGAQVDVHRVVVLIGDEAFRDNLEHPDGRHQNGGGAAAILGLRAGFIVVASSLLAAQSAIAADMPAKMYTKAPMVAPAYS